MEEEFNKVQEHCTRQKGSLSREKLVLQNAITSWPPEDSLQRQNPMPNPQHFSSRDTFESQQAAKPSSIVRMQSFKFKHLFCMLVAGPSRSGKPHWVVGLLRQHRKLIDPPVDAILYCYAHWQGKYDELKMSAPLAQFHKGLPPPLEHQHYNLLNPYTQQLVKSESE